MKDCVGKELAIGDRAAWPVSTYGHGNGLRVGTITAIKGDTCLCNPDGPYHKATWKRSRKVVRLEASVLEDYLKAGSPDA